MKIPLNKKTICKLVVGCFCLSLSSIALADESNPPPMTNCRITTPAERPDPAAMERHTSEQLKKLVNSKTITAKQAEQILNFFKQKAKEHKADMEKTKGMSQDERHAYFKDKRMQHPDFIGDLKNAAGLSDEQAKAVTAALRPHHRPDMAKHVSHCLDKLVSENTITKDQADKLAGFFKEKAAAHKAEMEKINDMTAAERDAYFKDKKMQHPDFIGDLKNAAGLSDEQAKTVAAALRPHHRPMHDLKRVTQCLNKLVSDNTLTQEQADKAAGFFKQREENRKADREKVKAMSPAERDAYFKEKMSHRPDFINDLKTAAGLSDEQVKAIMNALHKDRHAKHNPAEAPIVPAQ